MFLDKINKHANRISLNFLSFSGWVTLFFVLIVEFQLLPNCAFFVATDNSNFLGKCFDLLGFQFWILFIALILFILENFFELRIKNNFFLTDVNIAKIRIYGACLSGVFLIFPLFSLLVMIMMEIIDFFV